jgi:hypothetical protein
MVEIRVQQARNPGFLYKLLVECVVVKSAEVEVDAWEYMFLSLGRGVCIVR